MIFNWPQNKSPERAKFKRIVEIFFDIDRPNYLTTADWVAFRHKFFHKYTLPALINQDYGDFCVLLHCGLRNKALTESLDWDKRIFVSYDFGRDFYTATVRDFLSITRIDSDDLLRNDAMSAIRAAIDGNPGARAFAFKKNLCWDMINGIIFEHVRASSPFVTTIWPKETVHDWENFKALHFRAHGNDGLGDRGALELPKRMILVTKHGHNTNLIKRGKKHPVFSEEEKRRIKHYKDDGKIWPIKWRTFDPVEIAAVVSRFGVKSEEPA